MLVTMGTSGIMIAVIADFAGGYPAVTGFFWGKHYLAVNIAPIPPETPQDFANRLAADYTNWLQSIFGVGCTTPNPITITASVNGLNNEFVINEAVINTGVLPLPILRINPVPSYIDGIYGMGLTYDQSGAVVNEKIANQQTEINVSPCGEDSTPLNCPESWESHNRKLAERYANR